MTYRLPNPRHSDFGEGKTLLEAISDGRIFDIEPYGVGFKLTERCDDYFSLVLTAPQLYQLGTELRELAKIQPASEETTTMSNLSPAAQAVLDTVVPYPIHEQAIAAALRAVADQVIPEEPLYGGDQRWMYERDARQSCRKRLLAIAAELKGNSQSGAN